ncbi:MAG: WD40 repeat domain-containing protein [Opitutae bacterium]|nr:WD40 repeat domain-containing protein [Opitutae bacterium]
MHFAKHWAATLDDYVIDLAWLPAPAGEPDSQRLAAASAAGGITLYDATGAIVHQLPGHDNGTNGLAWAPVGREQAPAPEGTGKLAGPPNILATGGQDGRVRFWNATTGALHAEAVLGDDWVEHLAWSAVGSELARAPDRASKLAGPPHLFAAAGKKLRALRPDGSVAHAFKDAPKTITALSVAQLSALLPGDGPGEHQAGSSRLRCDAQPLLAAAHFGGVCVWNATTFALEKEFFYGNTIHALAWSPDGRWLVAGCQDNAVHLWAPAEDLELHMSGYETKLKELSFSHDSKWLATGGGKDVCVWDCAGAGPEGREPLPLPQTARTTAVAFQNRHGLLATGDAGGAFTLWSPTRKNQLVAGVKMPAAATKFAWSPDDSLLAVGTEKGAVYVFKAD